MTTVVNPDFVIDFKTESTADPYTHSDITNIDSTAELVTNGSFNEFRPNASGVQRFRYNGSVTAGTIISSIEIAQSNSGDGFGPAIVASNGEGYVVRISYGENVGLWRVTSGGSLTDIGLSEEYTGGYTAGDRFHLTLVLSTGQVLVHKEASELFDITDTTYDTGLAPAMYFNYGGNGAGIASFGGDTLAAGAAVPIELWQRERGNVLLRM